MDEMLIYMTSLANTPEYRYGRGVCRRALSFVPKRAGEYPRRECRKVHPNIGA